MKQSVYLLIFIAGLLLTSYVKAQEKKPVYADWPTAAIYAINFKERKLVLDKQVFRVAMKATISDVDNSKMAFGELEPQYFVAYRLEAGTGDIVDIITVAKP